MTVEILVYLALGPLSLVAGLVLLTGGNSSLWRVAGAALIFGAALFSLGFPFALRACDDGIADCPAWLTIPSAASLAGFAVAFVLGLCAALQPLLARGEHRSP